MPHLPLVLLLGDVHHTDENRCYPCSPPYCHPIESLEFLEELDELAKEYPIDFYTESDPNYLHPTRLHREPTRNVLFQYLIRNTALRCHDVPSRVKSKYIENCPTSYLRWHYADVRGFPNTIENYLYSPLQYTLEAMVNAYKINHEERKRGNNTELFYESFGYVKKVHAHINGQFPDKILFEVGNHFMIDQIHALSALKESDYTSESVARALCHVHHVFNEEKEMADLVLKGPIPSHFISQTILKQIEERVPHLKPYQEPIYHLLWKLFALPSPFKPVDLKEKEEIMAFIMSIVDVIFPLASFVHEQFQAYLAFLEKEAPHVKSGIWKQYIKQDKPYLRDPSQWITIFCKDILMRPILLIPFVNIYYFNTFFPIEPYYSTLEELITWSKRDLIKAPLPRMVRVRPDTPDIVPVRSGAHLMQLLSNAIHLFTIYMGKSNLDLYLLLRMLKTPGKGIFREEGVGGVLSIAFLGDGHCQFIRDILMSSPFSYREETRAGTSDKLIMKNVSRCLRLREPLSLRSEIERHVSSVKEWPNQRTLYQRRVREENRKRGVQRTRKTGTKNNTKNNKKNRRKSLNENNNAFYGS